MDVVSLIIDGQKIEVRESVTILEAAQGAGIYIPALCSYPGLRPLAESKPELACHLCVVEIEGLPDLALSCITPAAQGMVVHTNTARVQAMCRESLRQILVEHPHACLTCDRIETCSPSEICKHNVSAAERCVSCPKNGRCELQKIVQYIGVDESPIPYTPKGLPKGKSEPLFDRDPNLCVLCGRCVGICRDVLGVGAIDFLNYDHRVLVGPTSAGSYKDSGCKFCGACVEVCPTAALMDQGERWAPFPDREAALVPCRHACPAGIDVPRYIHFIAEGKFAEAVAVIREKVPFPGVLGHVCSHPCEDKCRRGELNEPIAIRALKRFASERDNGLWKQNSKVAMSTGRRVAIVGSGPAGLTTAYYLAKLGHSVTVFEALPEPGGMMRVGIPEFRLPRDVLDAEIGEIEAMGVEIRTGAKVESLDEFFEKGYQAAFLALGAHQDIRMGVEGEDSPGVTGGISFLREVNLGNRIELGDRVAVIGGGNTAIDASRVAWRLGAKEVTILYRRSRAEMPAAPGEVEEALREGVNITFRVSPCRICQENEVVRVECIRMKLGRPDASGRKRPESIAGTEFSLYCDNVISAIGNTPLIPEGFGLQIKEDKTLQVNSENLATSKKGVFAAGDVVSGSASVVEAIAMGRRAASSIDKYLGGSGIIEETLAPIEEPDFWLGYDEGFAYWQRVQIPFLPLEQRAGSFAEVELGLNEEAAIREAKRCLRCNLRLKISPIRLLPPLKIQE
jgi:NADPH-dependent glutamate synthase beta subunit-like oxidoreductase